MNDELRNLYAQKEAVEQRIQAIYQRSLEAPEDQKVCPDWQAEMLGRPDRCLQYPIEVAGITSTKTEAIRPYRDCPTASFVAVRPCGDEYAGKTYLGIMLGDIASGATAWFHRETGILEVALSFHNPAMWVPALQQVIWGMGSWWGPIESPEDLKQITDQDIENVWYVRAMREMGQRSESSEPPRSGA